MVLVFRGTVFMARVVFAAAGFFRITVAFMEGRASRAMAVGVDFFKIGFELGAVMSPGCYW